ncbi:MAG: aspartyl protease family protein [Ferruginibacter sp.]
MKRIIYATFFSLLSFTGLAQEILTPQPQAKFITRFPFKQYSGGVMIVHALLNDIPDTLNFILDTGSGGISIDSATASNYKIPVRPSDTTITGVGTTRKVNFAHKQTLHFPGLAIKNLDFHINNYDVLTSVYGEKIDGIIGYSFFSRYLVKINFDSSQIDVLSPGEFKYPRYGTVLRPAFTTLPIQNLHIKDKRKIDFNFYFDTGAGLCFLMSEAFAEDSSILSPKRKPIVTQAEGMGGRLEMKLTVIKMLQVGNYRFRNVPTYVFDDQYNVTSYPFVGGLLGNDLLRRFNLIINYPQKEIHLQPNSHYYEPFDYAYTGMATYYINGKIVVEDVVPGSPADKAGLKVDDILIGVNTSFSNNIMQYKTLLQTPNEKIKLFVTRDGKVMQLTIKPISIL